MHSKRSSRAMPGRRWLARTVLSLAAASGLLVWAAGGAQAQDASTRPANLLQSANSAMQTFLGNPQWEALRNLLGGARAVLIVPHDVAGGFLITASGGDGVLLRRHGESWSGPAFLHVGSVGVGFEAGGESQCLVMVIMTDAGVEKLIDGVVSMGGSSGIALADLGVGGAASGSVAGGLQVLTVSTAQGLFAGGGLQGTQLSIKDDYNQGFYGPSYNLATILAGTGGHSPAEEGLRESLAKAVGEAWGR
ncbi:MAG TPA: lipid-binding SYLF domain-containing protein [Dongiaceae bacterium]|nr:lipid-binding SYLF domain-containing protein [Dongiaceae bacterium]